MLDKVEERSRAHMESVESKAAPVGLIVAAYLERLKLNPEDHISV